MQWGSAGWTSDISGWLTEKLSGPWYQDFTAVDGFQRQDDTVLCFIVKSIFLCTILQ